MPEHKPKLEPDGGWAPRPLKPNIPWHSRMYVPNAVFAAFLLSGLLVFPLIPLSAVLWIAGLVFLWCSSLWRPLEKLLISTVPIFIGLTSLLFISNILVPPTDVLRGILQWGLVLAIPAATVVVIGPYWRLGKARAAAL